MGGIAGYAKNTNIFNCIVQNTYVYASTGQAGGFVGEMNGGQLQQCYQLGFSSNPSTHIACTPGDSAGGLIGASTSCTLFQCGVQQGKVEADCSFAGGAVGVADGAFNFTEVYVTSTVTVCGASTGLYGGLLGGVDPTNGPSFFKNSYSDAIISSGSSCSGGFVGAICSTNHPITFSYGSKINSTNQNQAIPSFHLLSPFL